MPAYSLHRASLVHSKRFGVRAAAVAALLLASVTAAVVLVHTIGGGAAASGTTTPSSHAALAPDRLTTGGTTRPKTATHRAAAKRAATKPAATKTAATAKAKTAAIPAPVKTPVAVLNGGTSQGAAAATASKLRAYGYPVPLVGNAGRRDLPSAIEYTPGLGAAARALARKIGPVSYVTPLDGPARNLSGARLLVIIGD